MSRTPEQQSGAGANSGPALRSTVVVAIGDLMLGSRAREALKALGMDAAVASSAEDLSRRLEGAASLFIVDLGEPRWNPLDAIQRAKARGIPVLAYGRHTDVDGLDAAAKAGADRVVPRSVFAASLPELIRELARPENSGA
jgi:CheY-like chemotaxis protein